MDKGKAQEVGRKINEHIEAIADIRTWLDAMLTDVDVGTLKSRPMLSMLSTACTYLIDNLKAFKTLHVKVEE